MSSAMKILLIEDDQAQADLMLEVFSDCKFSVNQAQVATDGEKALDMLYQRNGYESYVRPNLILLDLDIPKISGQEVLLEIKSNPNLQDIPVLVLTSSRAKDDIKRCYQHHANAYLVKPGDFYDLVELVEKIEEFWFSQVCYS